MISPLVSDRAWREGLQGIPLWAPPKMPTIIIAPHPDDESLAVGGLIKRLSRAGAEVVVIAVTDGEGAYENEVDLARTRVQEQIEALKLLGVSEERIIRLGLPDREVSLHESKLVDRLKSLVTSECHVIAPWIGDFHPDHEACGRAATHVAAETGASLSFYFFWTWHRGTPENLHGLSLRAVALDSQALQAKREAIQKHRTQLEHSSGQPILPDNLLGPTLWPFEVLAAA